jgi:hypothetical protein
MIILYMWAMVCMIIMSFVAWVAIDQATTPRLAIPTRAQRTRPCVLCLGTMRDDCIICSTTHRQTHPHIPRQIRL